MHARFFALLLYVTSAATLSAAHIDCAFVSTIGDMAALGGHGCRLDAPARGFIQRDFLYSAESTNGNPVPDAFSLGSMYFGGQIISGLGAVAGDTLKVTFAYTWETGTDSVSMLSGGIISSTLLPVGTALTTELCIGAAFSNASCAGVLSTITTAATGTDQTLQHIVDSFGIVGGALGFRQLLTLPGGATGHDYTFKSSGVISRSTVPEPGTMMMSCVALLGLTVKAAYRRYHRQNIYWLRRAANRK